MSIILPGGFSLSVRLYVKPILLPLYGMQEQYKSPKDFATEFQIQKQNSRTLYYDPSSQDHTLEYNPNDTPINIFQYVQSQSKSS